MFSFGEEVRFLHWPFVQIIIAVALVFIALRLILRWRRNRRGRNEYRQYWVFSDLSLSNLNRLRRRGYWFHLPKFLFLAAALLFGVALADPVLEQREINDHEETRQLVMMLDFSGSMMGGTPVPFKVATDSIKKLILRRTKSLDQYALLIFSDNTYIISGFTKDFNYYRFLLDSIKFDQYGESGTQIDVAVNAAKNYFIRHGDKDVKKRVLVIFTDADSNTDPTKAIKEAQREGITIYLIGIGVANSPNGLIMVDTVKKAGGIYFAGESAAAIDEAVDKIDQIETTKVLTQKLSGYIPLFEPWARAAFFVLVGALLIALSPWFRDFP
ncbi:MAG: vWA domain-containing protein [bacterium]|nr:vWA domain-containing protein [bacterium]